MAAKNITFKKKRPINRTTAAAICIIAAAVLVAVAVIAVLHGRSDGNKDSENKSWQFTVPDGFVNVSAQ